MERKRQNTTSKNNNRQLEIGGYKETKLNNERQELVSDRQSEKQENKTRQKIKDAGFVYESLRNETNRVIWEKNFHETNPRNVYLKKISTNPNHDTGSLILSLRNESTKRIFKVRIRESASLDL